MKNYLTIIGGSALLLTACGGNGEEASGDSNSEGGNGGNNNGVEEDMFLTIATGGTSGVYYPIGGALSNLYEGELGVDSSVQSTGASVENINLLAEDRAEMAITMSDAVAQAYEATGPFEEEEANEGLRGMASLYPNYVQLVTTADSGIESVEDLAGMDVGVGAPNSGVELNARMILEAHGMDYEDLNEDFLSYSEAIDQMQNNMVDAAFVTSGLPNSTVIDLATQDDVRIIPIEGEALASLQEEYDFFGEGTIPADVYDTEEDVQTATIMNVLLVNESLSEEEVYDLTKTMFDNIDSIHSSHNAAQEIDLDTVAEGMPVPFHPGAERYLEEEGVLDEE
ncbi:TAXI family TRAP transporter solute-binding subunit [Alkalicoccus halolimnae]|uniref:TAXI family TRAP transporter solute-binding subunit n=1 Tax=Alkalicoccus halolimnae TaxID=1667239 RepID=A0A5C7F3K8_9BACI|nr:TAXI family TRAP transporter solute-binding subunit [Alkalicoccus halolimnae]TXF82134.1 TAXI family TRAP transporter solute-binding subunit [Alkalicoccus halolimnae]